MRLRGTAVRFRRVTSRDGKAEKDNLYNRHAYQYQHGTPVAQDMVKFFSDKSDKLFHGCSVCV